jgi:hypothetical protein
MNILDNIKEWYKLSLYNCQKYYGIILTSDTYRQLQCLLSNDIILSSTEKHICSLYGLKILVFDELCKKYNVNCLCVDEPTFYAICEGKAYTDSGKKVAEALEKIENTLCGE